MLDVIWYVYIAECRDKTLYVGIAKDVEKRIAEHNNTTKCRYTRYRKPLRLLYKGKCGSYNNAREKEKEIKKFSRRKKLQLVEKQTQETKNFFIVHRLIYGRIM